MKTCLYNPIFINPQAYFVFPQLYDIQPKIEDYIESVKFSGRLIVRDVNNNDNIQQYENVIEIDFSLFAGKLIQIEQYTNIGNTVLGRFQLSGVSYYGVRFDGNATTGTRTGNMQMHKTLPIQSGMKGCTITSDGIVKYLNPTDWTKYEDSTARDMSLNTMVEIPHHYILFTADDANDSVEVRISQYELPGFVEVKKQYVSAYETYCENGVAKSIKGQIPTVNTTRASFQEQSRANGSMHWNMYTYQAHKAITWLFVVEYANRNSQADFNAALTSDGYHQGGLGAGVTTGKNGEMYLFVPTGTTDSLGNSTGVISYTASAITVNVPRYRGIENPFGHVWKNVIDVIVTGTDNSVYLTKDYTKFGNDKSQLQLQDFKAISIGGYISAITNNNDCDLFPVKLNGTSNTKYCDYYHTNPTNSDRTLLIGGDFDDNNGAGLFCLRSIDMLNYFLYNVGSRLTFYG